MDEEIIKDKPTVQSVANIRKKVINALWSKFDTMALSAQLKFLSLIIGIDG